MFLPRPLIREGRKNIPCQIAVQSSYYYYRGSWCWSLWICESIDSNLILGFQNESALELFFIEPNGMTNATLCGLVFNANLDQSLASNSTVTYKIRLRAEGYNGTYTPQFGTGTSSTGWLTNAMYARQLKPGPQGDLYGGASPGECDNERNILIK